jgi:putative redox protein
MATEVSLRLIDDLQFEATTPGGSFRLAARVDADAAQAGPSPVQAVLVSLAACGAMDVVSILRKMRQEVLSYEVRASGERATEHPRVFTQIALTHRLRGGRLAEENVRRAIQLSISRYCPIYAMLIPTVPIDVRYEIETPDGVIRGSVEPETDEQRAAG